MTVSAFPVVNGLHQARAHQPFPNPVDDYLCKATISWAVISTSRKRSGGCPFDPCMQSIDGISRQPFPSSWRNAILAEPVHQASVTWNQRLAFNGSEEASRNLAGPWARPPVALKHRPANKKITLRGGCDRASRDSRAHCKVRLPRKAAPQCGLSPRTTSFSAAQMPNPALPPHTYRPATGSVRDIPIHGLCLGRES